MKTTMTTCAKQGGAGHFDEVVQFVVERVAMVTVPWLTQHGVCIAPHTPSLCPSKVKTTCHPVQVSSAGQPPRIDYLAKQQYNGQLH